MTRLLTVNQAADVLQLHPDTVREHLRAGRLFGVKVGSVWRLPEGDLFVARPQNVVPARREPVGEFARIAREIQAVGPGPYGPLPVKPKDDEGESPDA